MNESTFISGSPAESLLHQNPHHNVPYMIVPHYIRVPKTVSAYIRVPIRVLPYIRITLRVPPYIGVPINVPLITVMLTAWL